MDVHRADDEEKRRDVPAATKVETMTRVVYKYPVVEMREVSTWVPPLLLEALKTQGWMIGGLTHPRALAEIEEGKDVFAPPHMGFALTVKRDGLMGALIFVPGVSAEDLL